MLKFAQRNSFVSDIDGETWGVSVVVCSLGRPETKKAWCAEAAVAGGSCVTTCVDCWSECTSGTSCSKEVLLPPPLVAFPGLQSEFSRATAATGVDVTASLNVCTREDDPINALTENDSQFQANQRGKRNRRIQYKMDITCE
jgi:hypothetical protein